MKNPQNAFSYLDKKHSTEKLLSVEEIALRLGISKEKVNFAIKELDLECEDISDRYSFPRKKKATRSIGEIKKYLNGKKELEEKKRSLVKFNKKTPLFEKFSEYSFWDYSLLSKFLQQHRVFVDEIRFLSSLNKFFEDNPLLDEKVIRIGDNTFYPQSVFEAIRDKFAADANIPKDVNEKTMERRLQDQEQSIENEEIELPEGWINRREFEKRLEAKVLDLVKESVKEYDVDFHPSFVRVFNKKIDSYLSSQTEDIRNKFFTLNALPISLLEDISLYMFGEKAKQDWVALKSLSISHSSYHAKFVKKTLEIILSEEPKYLEDVQKNVIWYLYSFDKTEAVSPLLIERLRQELQKREKENNEKKQEKIEREAKKQIENSQQKEEKLLSKKLEDYLLEVANGAPSTDIFRKLFALLGTSCLVDILYIFHPDFKKIPPTQLKSKLAKYLGDYIVVRSGDVLQDVEVTLPYLGKKSFQDSLFTVIKDDAIHYYQKEKKKDRDKDDERILDEYLTLLRDKAIFFHDENFNEVVDRVESYIFSLTNDFEKPDHIVDHLGKGRAFPDLNQIINIKEVKEQKQVLIADEMGMGKSASAILSKEYLAVGTALVVVPANVIDTWKGYLSDAIGPDGKQLGYFKKGQIPRVLVVEALSDIEKIKEGVYDYVLISHDRLSDECAEKLKVSPIKMVIIDEVHKFKNVSEGKRSKSLLELIQKYKEREVYAVLLSGTPIPNKIEDIAIVLKLLYPSEFGEMDSSILVSSIINGDNINLRDLLFRKTQMKKLSESIDMPEKVESDIFIDLSEEERELYQVLLEDDELTATEKLQTLRQFCLNPRKVFPESGLKGSKIQQAENDLTKLFETKNVVVFFMNGYVDGMLHDTVVEQKDGSKVKQNDSVLSQMKLPEDVVVHVIDGSVTMKERTKLLKEIRDDMRYANKKVLLAVNGGATDVGVDFSFAHAEYFYNEPWTKFDKMQQQARVYRPGLTHDITIDTSVTRETIEEGIHYYVEMKYKAVMKLLEGVPLSDIEKSILRQSEKIKDGETLEGDKGLAEEWLQSPLNRLNRFFGATKEIGEEKMSHFITEYGKEYAEYYADMGTRGFQANTSRFVTSLIRQYKKEKGIEDEMTILDIASGPEMLANKLPEDEKQDVFSLDINPAHFKEGTGRQIVAGFTQLPIRGSSVDYINMSLAIHYSKFIPSKEVFERLDVFGEILRALKVGGRCTINLVYSLDWKQEKSLKRIIEELGCMVIDSDTGTAKSGSIFLSQCFTFEKIKEINLEEKIEQLHDGGRELLDGLKLVTKPKTRLRNSQTVVDTFSLHGKTLKAYLNKEDQDLLIEQEHIQEEGNLLISEHQSVMKIPREVLLTKGFLKVVSGSKARLVKKGPYSKRFIWVEEKK